MNVSTILSLIVVMAMLEDISALIFSCGKATVGTSHPKKITQWLLSLLHVVNQQFVSWNSGLSLHGGCVRFRFLKTYNPRQKSWHACTLFQYLSRQFIRSPPSPQFNVVYRDEDCHCSFPTLSGGEGGSLFQ